MTYSETRFRKYIKNLIKDFDIYIHKLPDYKASGMRTIIGLPDYMVITKGMTYWFEVKQAVSKEYSIHTFNLNIISDAQYTEFILMQKAGATIFIAIYLNTELYIVPFNNILQAKYSGDKSVHENTLEKWRLTTWQQ